MTRDAQANECHTDRVQSFVGLVRHERELKPGAGGCRLQIVNGRAEEDGPGLLLVRTGQGFEPAKEDGKASAASAAAVHTSGCPGRTVQPPKSNATVAG